MASPMDVNVPMSFRLYDSARFQPSKVVKNLSATLLTWKTKLSNRFRDSSSHVQFSEHAKFTQASCQKRRHFMTNKENTGTRDLANENGKLKRQNMFLKAIQTKNHDK